LLALHAKLLNGLPAYLRELATAKWYDQAHLTRPSRAVLNQQQRVAAILTRLN
jgi:hypothetical protein